MLECIAGRSNLDLLSWYLGLAGELLFLQDLLLQWCKLINRIFTPCTRYDMNVMNNVLQDTPYLDYRDATYDDHNDV